MKRFLAALLIAVLWTAGCGGKRRGREAHGQPELRAPSTVPTPDTTPIETLRTPAGLVLKTGENSPAVTPSPALEPTVPAK